MTHKAGSTHKGYKGCSMGAMRRFMVVISNIFDIIFYILVHLNLIPLQQR